MKRRNVTSLLDTAAPPLIMKLLSRDLKKKKNLHVFFMPSCHVMRVFKKMHSELITCILFYFILCIYLFIYCGGVLQSRQPECHVSSLTRFGSELLSEVGGGPG